MSIYEKLCFIFTVLTIAYKVVEAMQVALRLSKSFKYAQGYDNLLRSESTLLSKIMTFMLLFIIFQFVMGWIWMGFIMIAAIATTAWRGYISGRLNNELYLDEMQADHQRRLQESRAWEVRNRVDGWHAPQKSEQFSPPLFLKSQLPEGDDRPAFLRH